MNLAEVMDAIATRLGTIEGLNCFGYPIDFDPPVPAAVVSFPEGIAFDQTYGRGTDRIPDLGVVLVVGRVSDRSARDQVGQYCNGSGPKSVKQTLESGSYTVLDEVVVTGVEFDSVLMASVPYLAALFTLDISGPGA